MRFYMYWWQEKNCIPNFGDALNPYLIEHLGKDVTALCVSGMSYKTCFIWFLSAILSFKKLDSRCMNKLMCFNRYSLCIGSILSSARKGLTVWGSGFMNANETISGGKILAVRGYESKKRLYEQGFDVNCAVGDPALLLPLVYKPNVKKLFDYGIIPHINDYVSMKSIAKDSMVIDLKTDDIEGTIDKICCCKFIFSTSLHGIIVAHAYGIPAVWIKKGYIGTDGFKFQDYFSTVGIDMYKPINADSISWRRVNTMEYSNYPLLPNRNIEDIWEKLLKNTPFPLKMKFRK